MAGTRCVKLRGTLEFGVSNFGLTSNHTKRVPSKTPTVDRRLAHIGKPSLCSFWFLYIGWFPWLPTLQVDGSTAFACCSVMLFSMFVLESLYCLFWGGSKSERGRISLESPTQGGRRGDFDDKTMGQLLAVYFRMGVMFDFVLLLVDPASRWFGARTLVVIWAGVAALCDLTGAERWLHLVRDFVHPQYYHIFLITRRTTSNPQANCRTGNIDVFQIVTSRHAPQSPQRQKLREGIWC